jgi:hypothetical protein
MKFSAANRAGIRMNQTMSGLIFGLLASGAFISIIFLGRVTLSRLNWSTVSFSLVPLHDDESTVKICSHHYQPQG